MEMVRNYDRDKLEVSCRLVNTIIKYVEEQGKDIRTLIEGLPYNEKYLLDTNNWVSRKLILEIYRRLRTMFDDDEILYKVGLASERLQALGFVDYVARLMVNPQFIIKRLPTLIKYLTKTDEIEIVKYGSSNATIRYYNKSGNAMTSDDCYYAKGILMVLPSILGVGPAKLWEESCAVPIYEKGRVKGKSYAVDENGYISEHDAIGTGLGKDESKIIGRLNVDGTFKLGDTIYGTKSCIYHISWPGRKTWFRKIFYELFTKPKVLSGAIEEMEKENDLIEQKYRELYEKSLELQKHYVDTISALIRAIDARDHYTKDHSLKVSYIAEAIAKELGLPVEKIEIIQQACKLHDLGKIGIKDVILLKSGKLNDEEWEEIKRHPVLGAEIIKPLAFLSEAAVLIRQDHERWDGRGYPDGLKGEEIDIGARVIMVADAYDAMVSGRSYREPLSKDEAVEKIKSNSGTQFDPKVVEGFLKVVNGLPPDTS